MVARHIYTNRLASVRNKRATASIYRSHKCMVCQHKHGILSNVNNYIDPSKTEIFIFTYLIYLQPTCMDSGYKLKRSSVGRRNWSFDRGKSENNCMKIVLICDDYPLPVQMRTPLKCSNSIMDATNARTTTTTTTTTWGHLLLQIQTFILLTNFFGFLRVSVGLN